MSAAARSRSASNRSTCAASASIGSLAGHRQHRPDAAGTACPCCCPTSPRVANRRQTAPWHVGPRWRDRHRHRHCADAEARTHDGRRRARAGGGQKLNTDGTLPAGVKLEPFYDRGDLVGDDRQHRVMHNLVFGIALIFLIQWLSSWAICVARIIVAATIPVALLLAVMITVMRAANRQTCCPSAQSISASSSMARSSWSKTYFRHLAPLRPVMAADDDEGGGLSGRELHRILRAAIEVDKRDPVFGDHHHRRLHSRCSRCKASKARFSGRWRGPTPTR